MLTNSIELQTMSIRAEWQASMQCGKRDICLWISVNFAGVNNSKSIPTKTSIDHCENVINFKVVSKNTMKRDIVISMCIGKGRLALKTGL